MVAPDKPLFMYFCQGCDHAPHHVFQEWAEVPGYACRLDVNAWRIFWQAQRAVAIEKEELEVWIERCDG